MPRAVLHTEDMERAVTTPHISRYVTSTAVDNLRRKSGLDLRTSFLDEADGALDSENAFKYLSMLRASHALAGTYHTLLITHRQELLTLIPQQIRLVPGEGVRIES
jgi:DNA repair exonuclease SbcCD ATPase subunit